MPSKKFISFWLCFLAFSIMAGAQVRFSLCNDLGLQHDFKKGQRYWAGGHTLQGNFHFSKTDVAYAWISYYSSGRFYNELSAEAKSILTSPPAFTFSNKVSMRVKQISLGWKKYLVSAFDDEKHIHVYGYAGFGLVLCRVINTYSRVVDTSVYDVPVYNGKGNFKRLTLDFGAGTEFPMGADFYFYTEARVWVPSTSYPSKYLFVNRDAPLMGMLNLGLRILF